MAYKTITEKQDVIAVDIQEMSRMSAADYRKYLPSLVYVDYHDILRSMPAGYPLAVTKEQMQALLEYLSELAPKVGAE